jgi:hypothetical protein
VHYGNADSGTANNYIFTSPTPGITAYSAGLLLMAKIANAPTGPSLINVAGLGFIPITRGDLTAIQTGDMKANQIVLLLCDGTRFQLVGALPQPPATIGTTVVTASGSFTTPTGLTVKVGLKRQSFLGNSSTSLPSSPADGTVVKYVDLVGNFQAYPVTVNSSGGGATIAGEASWTLNVNRSTTSFTFYASANSWGVE